MNDILNFKSITAYRVALPLKFEFKTSQGSVRIRESIIIRIEDQQGYVGYGECVAFRDPFYTAETVDTCWIKLVDDYIFHLRLMRPKPLMTYVKQLQFWLKRDAMPMTIAGLENALIHLHCSRIGVNSVSFMMGQPLIDTIRSGVVIGDVPIDELLPLIDTHVANGCNRIKLKVSPRDGYERTQLVRQAYPNLDLAVDANQSYTYDQILEVAAYNDLGLLCIEEPFQITNLVSYKKWRLDSDWTITTPICLDESVLGYDDLSYAIEHNLLDVLNVKVGRLGGLVQTRAAIMLCREHQIPYWIGSMVESSISKMMHVQLAALGDSYMPGDLSDSSRYFECDLTDPDIQFVDGSMLVPKGAGLGISVLDNRIEDYAIQKRVL
ncbi:MAG: o-succinylbenzoate synthase [Veillonella sp.]|uniref:o-succinylbenzoate synthase n=1 Tax=Veillonella caviae TaxID=248316 RepID=UPI000F8E4928|nr:o-succinylbenzoate synthase [Veillonella caviae]MCF0157657.1 o-succinylbenzoate synthase [Veillonella sp.]